VCVRVCVCGQYFDYVVRVLMPEMLVKIVMDVYHVSHDNAEEKLLAEPPDNYDDWYAPHCWHVTPLDVDVDEQQSEQYQCL